MKLIKCITALLALVLLAGCCPSPQPVPSPTPQPITEYQGIDVSVFQGDIDFEAAKADGIEAVYIRAGEGTDITDSQFEANYEKALAAELKFGFYYFVTAENAAEAVSQAQRFAGLLEGKTYELRPAMDFEDFEGLSTAELNAISLAFLQELEGQTNIRPALYTDAYAAESLWTSQLAVYPLWIADYGPGRDNPPRTGVWETWSGYQYSDEGSVSGIDAAADLDVFRSSLLIN